MTGNHVKSLGFARATVWLCVCLGTLLPAPFASEMICFYCGEALGCQYITFENRVYHRECYYDHVLPQCAYCGSPVGENWVVYEGRNYHPECFDRNVAIRCNRCGEIIEGQYLIDHWGNRYHKYHEEEEHGCTFCGRFLSDPLAGGGHPFGPAQYICSRCEKSAVTDEDEGRHELDRIGKLLAEHGIVVDMDEVEFKLVTRAQFAKLLGRPVTHQLGLTRQDKSNFWGFFEDRELTVYILTGLPRMHFISTAAHELMHAWLFVNAPEEHDDTFVEGSCNYASSLVLDRLNDDMAGYVMRQMEEEHDPVYGDGYRRVKHLIENRGVEYWLDHLRFDPRFPIGY
ncbi:MAG: protein DA1 [Candidatus Zixiibacteriota bacterium]